jgi:ribulose-5-phosphate 4-epimerase/fuculose-1-phosphate aldolase
MSLDESALRAEICRVGRSLHARGYVHGTTGNISARLDDGFLITATDVCLGDLEPDALVRVDAAGTPADADRRPSKTLGLHRRIYEASAEARCIIHTHSSHLVHASLRYAPDKARDDLLPPITPYFVMKVGHLPLIAYRRPGAPEIGEQVAEAIRAAAARGVPIRAVMLSRLGPNVWHETPAAAMAVLEECEETARLWLGCEPPPAPLTPDQIDELRRAFGARW